MKNLLKGKKEIKGITLVALVITIIVLLILAGVSIAMLVGENGLLGNAEKAIGKSENAQIQENVTLADYENEIAGQIDGTRNTSGFSKTNLLSERKEFTITQPAKAWTTINQTITLTDSIKNYDAICFYFCAYDSNNSEYAIEQATYFTDTIVYNNSTTATNGTAITLSKVAMNWGTTLTGYVLAGWFKNDRDFYCSQVGASASHFTKFILNAIYGIKY